MARNYYAVLGVPPDAGPGTIRSAFRRLALRHHPDRGDDTDTCLFREAAEAYGVLSDPEQRARYDRKLDRHRHTIPVTVVRVPVGDPEPLIPEAANLRRRAEPLRPEFPELIELLARLLR